MKVKATLMIAASLLAAAIPSFAAKDLDMGTWKVNEVKSHTNPSGPKITTITNAPAPGGMVKITVEGVDGHGNPTHYEWVGKFDGKPYPVKGEAAVDERSYTPIDNYTMTLQDIKNGKVVLTGRIVVAPDGKSRTLTTTSGRTDANGNKISSTTYYDKE